MVFKPDTKSESKAESEPKDQLEPNSEPEPKAEPEAEPEPKSHPEPKAELEAEPEPNAQPEPEAEPEAKASTNPYSTSSEFIFDQTTTTTITTITTTTTRKANDQATSRQGRRKHFLGTNVRRGKFQRKAEAKREEEHQEVAEKVKEIPSKDGTGFFPSTRLSSVRRSRPGQISASREPKNLETSPFMSKAEKDLVMAEAVTEARIKDQYVDEVMAEARRQAHVRATVSEGEWFKDVMNVQQLVDKVFEMNPEIDERVAQETKEEVAHRPRYQEEDVDVMAEALRQAHVIVRPNDMEQILKEVFEDELEANERVAQRGDGKVFHSPENQGEDKKVMAEAMRQAHVNVRHIDLATESTEDMVMKVLEDVMVENQKQTKVVNAVKSIKEEKEAERPSSGVIQAFRVKGDTRNQLIFMDLQVLQDAGIHLDRAGITLGFTFGNMVLIPVKTC